MKPRESELARGLAASAEIVVKEFASGDAVRWDAFVERCADATFFHRSGWRQVIESVFRHQTHYLYAERAGEIVGILPLAHVTTLLFGSSLASLPFCTYGGAAVIDPEARGALHRRARELAASLAVSHLELRYREVTEPDWPRQDLYVAFRKDLLADVDDKMTPLPFKRRNKVRKAEKFGLTSIIDESIDRFFALFADNAHQHGTPTLPKRYFMQLKETFGEDCEIITVLDTQGRGASTIMAFYFRDEVMSYYAGETRAARDLAANDFKYWALMRRAHERGCRVFDFGRSKRGTGSFEFKRTWGFEPTPLHYEYYLLKGNAIPQHNPMNPKYRALIACWQRLPLPVANVLGPWIVRGLG